MQQPRLDQLISVDQVAGCDVFSGDGLPTSWGRLFGGQILGQVCASGPALSPRAITRCTG